MPVSAHSRQLAGQWNYHSYDWYAFHRVRLTGCFVARRSAGNNWLCKRSPKFGGRSQLRPNLDRKSTRLNSSHVAISYAVFCLKKKKKNKEKNITELTNIAITLNIPRASE